jgi:hypothetical protein
MDLNPSALRFMWEYISNNTLVPGLIVGFHLWVHWGVDYIEYFMVENLVNIK